MPVKMSTTINAACDMQFPDPQSEKGLNFNITSGHDMRPFICPVCGGRGTVPHGFYYAFEVSTTCATPEMCRSCQGAGIVWR